MDDRPELQHLEMVMLHLMHWSRSGGRTMSTTWISLRTVDFFNQGSVPELLIMMNHCSIVRTRTRKIGVSVEAQGPHARQRVPPS